MSESPAYIPVLLNFPSLEKQPFQSILILAHGAGAPMDSPFMTSFSESFSESGVGIVRFEFPYMAQRRHGGSKRPPNKQDVLVETWKDLIRQLHNDPRLSEVNSFFLGGKSMGGRMATLALNEILDMGDAIQSKVKGVVCLGYPFHPSGKPEKLRTEHLPSLKKPALIVQGTRDALGNQQEVGTYELGDKIVLEWLDDGDHDFKPRKKSGYSHDSHILAAVNLTKNFIRRLS